MTLPAIRCPFAVVHGGSPLPPIKEVVFLSYLFFSELTRPVLGEFPRGDPPWTTANGQRIAGKVIDIVENTHYMGMRTRRRL